MFSNIEFVNEKNAPNSLKELTEKNSFFFYLQYLSPCSLW